MFVSEEDYSTLCDAQALQIYQQSNAENRERAERMAIEEIKSYLGGRYNISAIFGAKAEDRNYLLLMWVMDVALYHLSSWLPGRMGSETREKRYDKVIESLRMVATGKLTPFLEPATKEDFNKAEASGFVWNSDARNNNNW